MVVIKKKKDRKERVGFLEKVIKYIFGNIWS